MKIVRRGTAALGRASRELDRSDGACFTPQYAELAARLDNNRQIAHYGLEKYVLVVDGVVFRLPAPPAEQQEELKAHFYNGHYGCWGLTILVICDLRGRIINISSPYAHGEQAIAKKSRIRDILLETLKTTGAEIGILSDGLYTFNPAGTPPEEHILHQFTLSNRGIGLLHQLRELAPATASDVDQALYTTAAVSQMRVVVENVIALLRDYKVFGGGVTFRGKFWKRQATRRTPDIQSYMPEPQDVARMVAWLVNFRRIQTGIHPRAPTWQPKRSGALVDVPDDFQVGYPLFGATLPASNASSLTSRLRQLVSSAKASLRSERASQSRKSKSSNTISKTKFRKKIDGVDSSADDDISPEAAQRYLARGAQTSRQRDMLAARKQDATESATNDESDEAKPARRRRKRRNM